MDDGGTPLANTSLVRALVCLVAACGAPSSAPITNRAPVEETWYARDITVGTSHASSFMTEYTLRRSGDRASLTIVAKRVKGQGAPQPDWSAATVKRKTYAGAVTGDVVAIVSPPDEPALHGFPFTDDVVVPEARSERLARLRCVEGLKDVAPSGAVRRPDPTHRGECGNQGVWSLPTQATWTLTCTELDVRYLREVVFGQPGIETYVFYNDDCNSIGGGLRMIASDIAIHAFE